MGPDMRPSQRVMTTKYSDDLPFAIYNPEKILLGISSVPFDRENRRLGLTYEDVVR